MIRGAAPRSARDEALLVPAADAVWLTPLLDPTAAADLLGSAARRGAPLPASCSVRHVRYRPGASCTVLYDMTPAGGAAVPVYARALAPGRGEAPSDGDAASGVFLDGPTPVAGGSVVLREFPCDATMPQLGGLARPEGLAAALATALGGGDVDDATADLQPLRYKPEHRLVMRADLRWRRTDGAEQQATGQLRFEYGADPDRRIRVRTQVRAALLAGGSEAPAAAAPGVPVAGWGCSIAPWRAGQDLSRDLHKGRAAAAELAGRALAGLQRADVDLAPDLDTRTATAALEPAVGQIAALAAHPALPGLADRFGALCDRLAAACPGDGASLVHGDFHQGQMLLHEGRLTLLDWDCAHRGDHACDYGRFLAQLHLLELRGRCAAEPLIEAFTGAHLSAGGRAPEPERALFWTALALTDLALREVRRLRSGWHLAAEAVAARAGRLLEEGGAG